MKQRAERRAPGVLRRLRVRLAMLREQMSSSLFAKYFLACAGVMLISFAVLAAALTFFSARYSAQQKKELYTNNALQLAQYAQIIYSSGQDANNQMASVVKIFSETIDANIFITDTSGALVTGRLRGESELSSITQNWKTSSVPASVMKSFSSAQSSYYESAGTLDGYYSRSYIIVGEPIVDMTSGTVVGAVFVSSRADSMLIYMRDLFRVFTICVGLVLIFTFACIYYITQRLVRPLRQMASAARSFAQGDLSKRVPVGDHDEIGQLAVAFNNMAASLVSLEEMRRSFVANVSHELRTPMTSIAGFIDGILDGTIPPEKQQYYLQVVSDEVKRLSRLVRSLLDIARIEAGEVRIQQSRFDAAETIRRVMVGFEYAFDEKKLHVVGMEQLADKQLFVMADPDVTHQIFYNLVDNAIKFSNPGGTIAIATAARDQRVFISVHNTGAGIPAADLPHVFERFYKTDKSRSTDRKGVGLGLYIVKSMLVLQGQNITVRSEEGKYCEFVFTLARAA